MNKSRFFLKSTAWLMVDRLFRLALSFAVGVLIARQFGPIEFGQIAFVVATAAIFNSLATLGLDDIVPNDLCQEGLTDSRLNDMLFTAFVLRLIGGGLAYLSLLLLVFVSNGLGPLLKLAAIFGPYFIFESANVFESKLRADGKFGLIARIRSFASFFANLIKLAVVFFELSITWIAAAMAMEFAVNAILFILSNHRVNAFAGCKFVKTYAKDLLSRSWKVVFAGVLVMLQSRIEYFLVESYLGWGDVGQYAAALKFVELFDLVTSVLMMLMLPELARRYRGAPTATVRQAYLVGCLAFLVVTPVMVLGVWLFPLVYGESFGPAAQILPLLMLRPFFIMLIAVRNMLLVIQSKFWYPPLYASIGATASLGVGLFVVPAYGLYGAAFCSVIGLLSSCVIADILFNRENFRLLLTCWQEFIPLYRHVRHI